MSPAYRPRAISRIRNPLLAALALLLAGSAALAAPCSFEPQGEGRVAAVIDARSFRLADGREIRLAGIEPVPADAAKRTAALSAILAGRDVTLTGEDDAPDRYGRQTAFAFVTGEARSVQAMLLAQGEAFAAADIQKSRIGHVDPALRGGDRRRGVVAEGELKVDAHVITQR
jgi:hypothetical protein